MCPKCGLEKDACKCPIDEPARPPAESPGTAKDLKSEFESGKARLHGEKEVGIKRGRGRPPKKKGDDRATTSAEPAAAPPPQVSLKPALVPLCQLPFDYLARRTGYPGCKATAEEVAPAVDCFDQGLNLLMAQYFPQLQGPWALITAGAFALGMVALGKLSAAKEFLAEKARQNDLEVARSMRSVPDLA